MPQPEPQFDDLYREVILDHYRRPRNRGALDFATQRVDGMNPVCGDEIHLDIRIAGDTISDIAFAGLGCSISLASASMLTESVKGRTIEQANDVMASFRAMMIDGAPPSHSKPSNRR